MNFSQTFRGWTLDKMFNFYTPSIDYKSLKVQLVYKTL